jgi:hypothetical protein
MKMKNKEVAFPGDLTARAIKVWFLTISCGFIIQVCQEGMEKLDPVFAGLLFFIILIISAPVFYLTCVAMCILKEIAQFRARIFMLFVSTLAINLIVYGLIGLFTGGFFYDFFTFLLPYTAVSPVMMLLINRDWLNIQSYSKHGN